ncbi:M48 family metalloprotease [Acidithiobacillus ferrooxidans]|uniref:M48 family metalloprotease n=1 Tax=Acidithiobacillus ferrooxidans TaxID=920 RepID=UPI003D186D7C
MTRRKHDTPLCRARPLAGREPSREWLDTAASIADQLNIRVPRVTMGPAWFMGPNAGMTLPNGRVLVNPKALKLPDDARRYVMAHEIGHVTRRHGKAAFLAFAALVLLYAVNPALCGLIGWTYIFAVLVPYGLGDRAEFQADATAADVMGSPYAVIRAQREVMRVMGTGATPQRERRWQRLRTLAQAQTERERRSIASGRSHEPGGDGVAGE